MMLIFLHTPNSSQESGFLYYFFYLKQANCKTSLAGFGTIWGTIKSPHRRLKETKFYVKGDY